MRELLVAFTCKGREVCPSCTSRRAHDVAAHFVDRVFPRVPVRQWVFNFASSTGAGDRCGCLRPAAASTAEGPIAPLTELPVGVRPERAPGRVVFAPPAGAPSETAGFVVGPDDPSYPPGSFSTEGAG